MDITLGPNATTVEPTTTAEPEPTRTVEQTTTAEDGIVSWANEGARGRRDSMGFATPALCPSVPG